MLEPKSQLHGMKGIALKGNIWNGPLQVEGDLSARPWKPVAAKWSLINSAGAPPNSH